MSTEDLEAPWSITRSTQFVKPWCVAHPRMHPHVRSRTYFATHAEALAFVLAQPEVRRRTSKPVDPLLRSADA